MMFRPRPHVCRPHHDQFVGGQSAEAKIETLTDLGKPWQNGTDESFNGCPGVGK